MSLTRYGCLAGRVVLITGGASGIGAAFVRAFAANGARVGFLDLDVAAAAALADEVEAEGAPRPEFVACDLLDIPALKAAFGELHGRLGDAAVLVNNAANDRRQDFLDVSEAAFDWSFGVNFKHHYFAAQAVVPQMQRLGFGSIVNMSSIAWMAGGKSMQAYSAAKAAVVVVLFGEVHVGHEESGPPARARLQQQHGHLDGLPDGHAEGEARVRGEHGGGGG